MNQIMNILYIYLKTFRKYTTEFRKYLRSSRKVSFVANSLHANPEMYNCIVFA